MKQIHGIVIYKRSNNTLLCVSAVTQKNNSFNLIMDGDKKYNSFNELYTAVLQIIKNNNFYVKYTEEFSARLYDITFINIERPGHTEKLYYKGVFDYV